MLMQVFFLFVDVPANLWIFGFSVVYHQEFNVVGDHYFDEFHSDTNACDVDAYTLDAIDSITGTGPLVLYCYIRF
jgi:hypothetical protein